MRVAIDHVLTENASVLAEQQGMSEKSSRTLSKRLSLFFFANKNTHLVIRINENDFRKIPNKDQPCHYQNNKCSNRYIKITSD